MKADGIGTVAAAANLRASYESDLGRLHAFLPDYVPLGDLPAVFAPYLAASAELPARYPALLGGVRAWLDRQFGEVDAAVEQAIPALTEAQRDRATTLFCALGHTYRWDSAPPAPARFAEREIALPPGIAGPWSMLAGLAGQPRVGTTWSLHLCNWRLRCGRGGVAYDVDQIQADSIQLLHNWLAPPYDRDLANFSLSFVILEARGAAVLRHLVDAVDAAAAGDAADLITSLAHLHHAIAGVTRAFSSAVRRRTVDPTIWLEVIQPTFGWAAVATEPGRLEGGPSGMQLGTIQALDAAFGVPRDSVLAAMAQEGRRYLLPRHRRFLAALEGAAPVLRSFVESADRFELTSRFNQCVRDLARFRSTHHARASQYIGHRPQGHAPRASTALLISPDDDAVGLFQKTMEERTVETLAALVRPPTS